MKKKHIVIAILLLALVSLSHAQPIPEATTPNLGLTKPATITGTWGDKINQNLDIIDSTVNSLSNANPADVATAAASGTGIESSRSDHGHKARAHNHVVGDPEGILTNDEHAGYGEYAEITAPPTPPAGKKRIFIDLADGKTKVKDSSGAITSLEGEGITDHGALTGLLDDDHTQYPLKTILTTKGDVYVRDASGPIRVGVGTNGQHLEADSAQASGVKWATPSTTPGANSVGTGELKTATGSATGSIITNIAMNDFSFFPNIHSNTSVVTDHYEVWTQSTSSTGTIGRFKMHLVGTAVFTVRWRYVTASRPGEIVILRRISTDEIVGVWKSQIDDSSGSPFASDDPGIEAIEITKFPDRLLPDGFHADHIMAEIKASTLTLGGIVRGVIPANHPLKMEANARGRVLYKNAFLSELN